MSTIVDLKELFYGIALLIVLAMVYRKYIHQQSDSIIHFLVSSCISIALARLQSQEVLEYQKAMLGSVQIDTILNQLLEKNGIGRD